jgi:hypothetical protein
MASRAVNKGAGAACFNLENSFLKRLAREVVKLGGAA